MYVLPALRYSKIVNDICIVRIKQNKIKIRHQRWKIKTKISDRRSKENAMSRL
jgi:hypothetical protein